MKSMDARDTLTVLLLTARKRGIVIEERRFVEEPNKLRLQHLIQDVREDLQALEGQLARCEEMARREAAKP